MKFDYIIVQCGGKGTRLGKFTINRPKALVPVHNRPILFHLFEKYPQKKYIIIGDYKSDVLNRYLERFADVQYVFVQSDKEGNIAGILDAFSFLPSNEPFLLLWSDLILGDDFLPESFESGNYIGLTNQFPCSWSFSNGKLQKEKTETNGVAGCFFLQNKDDFENLPIEGSFTRWLQNQSSIELIPMDMKSSYEVGTIDSLEMHSNSENRCRPYNDITISGEIVKKIGLTEEAKHLIEREVIWYKKLSSYNFKGIPEIYSEYPLTMELIHGTNIFRANISEERKIPVLKKLIYTLSQMHSLTQGNINYFDMQTDYYQKTIKRLRSIESVIPFAVDSFIQINGKKCVNPLAQDSYFRKVDAIFLNHSPNFGIIHGDCTFTNTLIDNEENIYFIDARGYFGNTAIIGDTCYDWAKVYYSVVGSFDNFNIKKFSLSINKESVQFDIEKSGWEQYEQEMFKLINQVELVDEKVVQYIHSIIWLSLASHCWEDYDSMCLAFYKGVELFQQLLDRM